MSCGGDQVIIVNGSQQALDLIARVLVDPGDRVVIEDPHYRGARLAFETMGADIVPVPVDADGLDVRLLPTTASRQRLAYVTPSHQFPTGSVMPVARRLALLKWASAAGAWIVEDDYDSEYRYEGRPLEALQPLDRDGRVIYVGPFSNVLFPSLRLGYIVLPKPLVALFTTAKWVADRHSATLEQMALADFFTEGHFERHVRRARASAASRRRALLAALDECFGKRVEISGSNAGIHLLAWFEDLHPSDVAAVVTSAASIGIGIYNVADCYRDAPSRAGILFGYGSLSECAIQNAVMRLAHVIRSRQTSAFTKPFWSPTRNCTVPVSC
jgi:GntR family transcriptional regulator/MocR family aminotransferase